MRRRHEVNFSGPRKTSLGSSAIVFEVKVDGEDLGDLRIRRGTIDWKPTKVHYRYRLTWQQVAELAEQYGTLVSN